MIEISNGYRTTWLSDKKAADLIQSTTKTIQRYKTPEKRDPAKWQLLTALALGQMLPSHWNMTIADDYLYTDTGYHINQMQIEQYGWHMTTMSSLHNQIDQLKARISELERHEQDTRPDNVILFPSATNNGDLRA